MMQSSFLAEQFGGWVLALLGVFVRGEQYRRLLSESVIREPVRMNGR